VTGTGSANDPLVISTTIASDPLNIIECTENGLFASVTANNGLTKTANNIQLGGALIIPTTISTDPVNTLSLTGLSVNNTPNFILTQTTLGVVQKISSTTLTSSVLNTLTADNGLTKTGSNIQLGGPLIQNTSVDLATYTLNLKSGVNSLTGIQIIPGTASDCVGCAPNCSPSIAYDWNTDVFNIDSKLRTARPAWFQGNAGFGESPDSNNPNCGNGVPLISGKAYSLWNPTYSSGRGSITGNLTISGALGNDTSNGEITSGIGGTLNVGSSNNVTLKATNIALYSGLSGRIGFGGFNGGVVITGTLAGVASRSLFTDANQVIAPLKDGPSLDTYVGFQALSPQAYGGGAAYTGTLTNAVGVQIENQRSGMGSDETSRLAGGGKLVNSWGVRQLGNLDRNYFAGNTGIGTNPYPAVDTAGDGNLAKLFVARGTDYRTSSLTTAIDSLLTLSFVNTEDQNFYTATCSRLQLNPQAAVTVNTPDTGAIIGYVQSTGLNSRNITNDRPIAGVIGKHYFDRITNGGAAGANVKNIAALKASAPIANVVNGYGGTITNSYGVFIEDQRDQIIGDAFTGTITNSYGVYQEGVTDTNYFNGPFRMPSSNISIGTATLVAGTATVATTAVKTGAKIFLSVNTPGGTQGFLSAPAASITNGTSFVINSSDVADTSTVNWWIINN
jgi:hypothetical protein